MDKEVLVQVSDVSKTYSKKNWLGQEQRVDALTGVNVSIYKGETLGLVGESGSGKSTLSKIVLGLEKASQGRVDFPGLTVEEINNQALQVIYQDPYSSLNPFLSALELVKEPLYSLPKKEAEERALAMLKRVGIEGDAVHKRPKSFSGGQRQRIGIARAVVSHPKFIVCDEPTSALDVSIQATILDLLNQLQEDLGLTYLFISHDLNLVHQFADRIAVMYKGSLVEIGPAQDIFQNPQHPYTRYLLQSNLSLDPLEARAQLQELSQTGLIKDFVTDGVWTQVDKEHFVLKATDK
ncbi:ATP-binding cassette domain-containing protein [Streptococcus suis]|uniref:ATP-binding cassette domain-containing protein n=1 Tax=Streptococcus suis TaxID=1307 RepID=UPI00211C42AE|nr:ATP-binding cassette domain-containing protein [Streptococcus suis]MCQ9225976.1 ATP-binding cassette domain-containing protein [Streptococcus suis]MCQ9228328.1 ATP-binding cassette domain-containing protein [Streptococcus suis]MCQ9242383.1 ATP-binding cassette domain-containing protein [Streptococcus suis]MCQ9274539.1 ATP-binding cassette domain-containing protein [Streptococcus suis]MDE7534973.1 ATP-binding cassette domain-containing protein [Streptococcus suis]